MTLDEARENIGRSVAYKPRGGDMETGVITSVNDFYVFVRYGTNKGSSATYAHDLVFEFAGGDEQ